MSKDIDAQIGQLMPTVSITPEECIAALDFWKHLNIPIPSLLLEAINKFSQNPTLENQDLVKLEICRAIAESDHPVFKDPIFEPIVQECASVTFEMQFNKDIEKILSEE